MKTILVPTDFSENAKNAAQYAIDLAASMPAKIVLFHAFHLPATTGESLLSDISIEGLEKESESQLKEFHKSLHEKKSKHVKLEYKTKLGFAVDEIVRYCNMNQVDMIIMGVTGKGYLGEKLMGSNTTELIHKLNIPVLIIPLKTKFQPVKKIAFATDDKDISDDKILQPLFELVNIFKSKVMVFKVVKEEAAVETESIHNRLSTTLNFVDHHDTYYTENEDIADGINEFVEKQHADMMVMIPRKHDFLDRLLHPSNTKKMAFHTDVPLLALPDLES